ncbi:DUF4265 domain-containing protein [Elizabethkingia anophelis]|nr:DUF4265 domain-containing protein [Elizabethkingia anophelis]MCT3958499.1 DUF4265 domain-containing protein [Elizabethkingia anophelis]
MKDKNKKVFFVQKTGEEEFETESLWCIVDGDNFIVDNIPFIAKRVSLGDTIKVEFDEDDKQYYFDDFIASSGNTTVRIYFKNSNNIETVRNWLTENQCESEVLQARKIVAINIPKEVDYSPIKKYLDNGEDIGIWTYEESCLEHNY